MNQETETQVVPGSIGEEPKYQGDSYGDSGYMQGQMVRLSTSKGVTVDSKALNPN